MLRYTVHRAFTRQGTYFTRENADAVRDLSRAERDQLIDAGYVTEHDDRAGDPAEPAPAAAATPSTRKGGK